MTVIKKFEPIEKSFSTWYEAAQNDSVEAAKIINKNKEEKHYIFQI